jgi:hypothetical protein
MVFMVDVLSVAVWDRVEGLVSLEGGSAFHGDEFFEPKTTPAEQPDDKFVIQRAPRK